MCRQQEQENNAEYRLNMHVLVRHVFIFHAKLRRGVSEFALMLPLAHLYRSYGNVLIYKTFCLLHF